MSEIPNRLSPLFTDLYELTMASSYFREQMFAPATFSLFVRTYPHNWGYFVAAGLHHALEYVENFQFTADDIQYLRSTGMFPEDFLAYLREVRFTGHIRAMREGELFFANEPILEVTAPIIEAQLLETRLINIMHLESLICTKAARCMAVSRGKTLVDFSLRRTHGSEAGLLVARSSYIAGFDATSNVLAGKLYGIPISGTMAHSYVTTFEDEIESFRAFARSHPRNTILLVDTYDTLSGVKKACVVGREMKERGQTMRGVRLDSGDMADLSKKAREILDEAGLSDSMIIASSGFDEYKIRDVLRQDAPIDGFGVGTNMGVSKDSPYVDMAYKLVEYDARPVLKLSEGKVTLPAEKQVYRFLDRDGRLDEDVIALRSEDPVPDAVPLLHKVMEMGKRTFDESLDAIRSRCATSLGSLPPPIATIENPAKYTVRESERLREQMKQVAQRLKEQVLS
ncbi:MAG: nicotinate phosphoribosyltransferase [Candidatus Abyssobacteria bacterium SURF_5]|uniref:Nicotinate phosphoribosyltransferase n=1 Tax=Abyssobacteria bacterium (strain SURF_5) TaxID=2093360 RepID=A0A3A4NI45_ABYX5|nr:MAG: nicotinate phosphoribosyltransferase [Candidatus Abyssubacteria bacterium SURF_5]